MQTFVQSYLQAQVFFFISSMGFIVLWVLAVIFLYYLVRSAHILSKILAQIETDVENIGETTGELLEAVHNNIIFKFLFGKRKKRKKS